MAGTLNHKQQLFVKFYVKSQNGTQAALDAGYCKTRKAAHVHSTRLLRNASIKERIEQELANIRVASTYTAKDVLRGLQEIADADLSRCYYKDGNLKPIHKIPKSVRKAIAGIDTVITYEGRGKKTKVVTKKLRFWDKTKALELSGKHMMLFTEKHKVEHTGKDGAPLEPLVVVLPAKNEVKK